MATTTHSQTSLPGAEAQLLHKYLLLTAAISGVFVVLVGVSLLYYHFSAAANDPWKSPHLLALKHQLNSEPKNEALKVQIRQFDFEFRKKFRQRLALDRLGGWLLAGGMVIFVLTVREASLCKKTTYLPTSARDSASPLLQLKSRARWSVAVTGGCGLVGLVLVAATVGGGLPDDVINKKADKKSAPIAEVVSYPTIAELQTNSPRFRGWDGCGVTLETNFTLSWDSKTGSGIAWTTPILTPGHSSPVVWHDQIFISGGTAEKREVFCYSVADGKLQWRRAIENVPGSPPQVPEVFDDTGYAASTMATDGRHVFVIFANADLAALNFNGSVAWSKFMGPMKNTYGHASSLASWQGKLIVQLDQGESNAKASKLYSIDGDTGQIVWSQSRPVPASWATPIIIETAGKTQIMTLALPLIISHSFKDGGEIWRAEFLENEIVPSPIFASGMVIAISPSSKLLALSPEGTGDVTKTQLKWSSGEAVPDIASPVSNGELVFTATSSGMLTCFDIKTGARIWQQDLGVGVQSSLSIVGDKLFIMAEKGVAVVVKVAREYHEISRSELTDKFISSPAFANGRLFLRGETNLYCIGPQTVPVVKQP